MSIKKYTNIENINNRKENEGKFIEAEDLFIITKQGEIQDTDFGECKYDVMEVSVYDINNNLLPNKSGNTVSYIKTGDIKNYLYSITNNNGKKELIINSEKLLNDIGFTNGILKVNINFVRNRIGDDNDLRKVWIQEISPSREEIRILPLKARSKEIQKQNENDFNSLENLNVDFKQYKKSILTKLDLLANNIATSIEDYLTAQFGKDLFGILKKDFGISNFKKFRAAILDNFKLSVTHYLNNKYYNIEQGNFGQPATPRFFDCEVYNPDTIKAEIQNILRTCIDFNVRTKVNRRVFEYSSLPKSFEVVELQKLIKDNLEKYNTITNSVKNIYIANDTTFSFDDISQPPPEVPTTETVKPVVVETPQKFQTSEPEPAPVVEEEPLPPKITIGDEQLLNETDTVGDLKIYANPSTITTKKVSTEKIE